MIHHRKNFDNAWFSFKLGKEDVASVEKTTIGFGLRTLLQISKVASANNIKLSETDRAALLVWSALTFESFASDYIEAKEGAKRAKPQEQDTPTPQ